MICRRKGGMSKYTMKIYAWTRNQTWDPCKINKSGALPLSFPGQYPQSKMIQRPKPTKIQDVYTKKKRKSSLFFSQYTQMLIIIWLYLNGSKLPPTPQCRAGTHFSFSHSTTTVPLPCRVWYTCSILSEVSPAWSLHRPSLSCHCHWPFFSPIKKCLLLCLLWFYWKVFWLERLF